MVREPASSLYGKFTGHASVTASDENFGEIKFVYSSEWFRTRGWGVFTPALKLILIYTKNQWNTVLLKQGKPCKLEVTLNSAPAVGDFGSNTFGNISSISIY